MPKNIEDIIPTNKRSIRDIPIPASRRKAALEEMKHRRAEPVAIKLDEPAPLPRVSEYEETGYHHHHKRHGGKKRLWVSIAVAVIILIFAVLSLFSSATLAYVPKSLDLTFNRDTFTAHKSGDSSLLFSVVKLSGEKGAPVTANGEEQVSKKATGTIIVYNTTSSAQKLIATTRFATPDGKEYRIPSAITIPAKGSVETVVNADKPGTEYNIGMSDFTVPGLKGDPRYSSIYGRSKTAMTGGFVGRMKKVDPQALAAAKTTLETSLKEELMQQAKSQVPEDFILFPALSTVSYDELPQSNQSDNGVMINERGNFYGVMFKKSDFAKYLADKKTEIADADIVDMPSVENLNLSFSGSAPADLLKAETINFEANGTTKLVWVTDENALRMDLAGAKKSNVTSILKNFPSIFSADAVLRPFWKTSFPKDATKINIKEKAI